ncbi:MAG TPA: hypothetical protein VGT61_09425 [Thermomicrobiales bacterium]|nr:hypothetical protein [Thermomicrobiales bacterium]
MGIATRIGIEIIIGEEHVVIGKSEVIPPGVHWIGMVIAFHDTLPPCDAVCRTGSR